MAKTYAINKRVHPARLHEALAAAGFTVLTVRAGPSSAEAVIDGDPADLAVEAVIAAHDPDSDPDGGAIASAIAILEDPNKTVTVRLAVCCEVLARLLRRGVR